MPRRLRSGPNSGSPQSLTSPPAHTFSPCLTAVMDHLILPYTRRGTSRIQLTFHDRGGQIANPNLQYSSNTVREQRQQNTDTYSSDTVVFLNTPGNHRNEQDSPLLFTYPHTHTVTAPGYFTSGDALVLTMTL